MDLYMPAAVVLRSEILHTIAHGLYVQEQSSLSHVQFSEGSCTGWASKLSCLRKKLRPYRAFTTEAVSRNA